MATSRLPLVSVVIPAHDNLPLTKACLASVNTFSGHIPLEIILVDDGSHEETVVEARAFGTRLFGGRFFFVQNQECLGFAASINRGVRRARGRYVFLLNNDTEFRQDVVAPLLDFLDRDGQRGAVGPLLLYPESNRVQHLGVTVAYGVKCVHLYHLFPAAHPVVPRQRTFQAITMAAFLMEREVFLDLGGLCEGYRNGMEDIDFCARLSRRGKHCAVLPEVAVVHLGSQSVGRFDHDRENSALLAARAGELLTPDMAGLGRADGYILNLTPWLDPYFLPDSERGRALDAAGDARPDPGNILELLDVEPCWERGYDLLARHFRRSGDPVGELSIRVRQSAFLPTPGTFAVLFEAARRAGDDARMRELAAQEARIRDMFRGDAPRVQARAALERAKRDGNDVVADLFKRWFREGQSSRWEGHHVPRSAPVPTP